MDRSAMTVFDNYAAVVKRLGSDGLLLGSYDATGKANFMTIGWGTLGIVWSLPMWIVLVRPSRYTYECIEHSGCFTVNVPTEAMGLACVKAGSVSGRTAGKFAAAGLTAEKSTSVLAPLVAECPLSYECRVIHSNDVLPNKLASELSGLYVDEEPHRIYHGRILAARASADVEELLAG
jgi:flavin reductase (DIM6/NTAB) family NADH-FMN oxidoreductase RutF